MCALPPVHCPVPFRLPNVCQAEKSDSQDVEFDETDICDMESVDMGTAYYCNTGDESDSSREETRNDCMPSLHELLILHGNFEELAASCRQTCVPEIKYKPRQTSFPQNGVVDFIAKTAMPSDAPSDCLPMRMKADGNCFFRAASMSVFGEDSFHVEMHARVTHELVLNSYQYKDSKYLA